VEHKLSPSPPSPTAEASPPRIAFLISGSAGDASALRRVLLALYHPRNRYILHLDAEAPDSDRRSLAADLASHPAIATAANVRVVDRANLVTYRGPTMVANTLHAAAAFLWGHAGDGSSHWDWFINLSASDYPLVTQDGKCLPFFFFIQVIISNLQKPRLGLASFHFQTCRCRSDTCILQAAARSQLHRPHQRHWMEGVRASLLPSWFFFTHPSLKGADSGQLLLYLACL